MISLSCFLFKAPVNLVSLKSRILSISKARLSHTQCCPYGCKCLVGSWLDCCNSLFMSISALDLCVLQCAHYSLFRILTDITKYSRTTPVRKTLCLLPLNNALYLRLSYMCTSYNIVVILNILKLFVNLNKVCTIYIEVKLMMYCSRFHTLPHRYVSLLDEKKKWLNLGKDPDHVKNLEFSLVFTMTFASWLTLPKTISRSPCMFLSE